MVAVLLTGGSGFVASHVLTTLLEHGHSVVTTVRSQEKAKSIREAHPNVSEDKLSFAIVEDVAKENAFDHVFSSASKPFDAVIHTASPFHYDVKDIEKELLQPALVGTTGVLKAIKKYAPSVKRVVITSSFVAVMDFAKPPSYKFSDKDWNPITREQALSGAQMGYCASKTYAEKAAWKFMDEEKPNFTLATVHPVYVFGPIDTRLDSLDKINESNTYVRDAMIGNWKKNGLPEDPPTFYVDVRDVAAVHVAAMEKEEAAGRRFLTAGGNWDVNTLVDALRKTVKDKTVQENLPTEKKGGLEEKTPVPMDTEPAQKVLGIKWRSLEESVKDTADSILEVQSRQK